MSIVVLELQDVGSARDGGASDYAMGVVAHDLLDTPSVPHSLTASGAVQVGGNCKFVRVTNLYSDTTCYFRVSPKWITSTSAALPAGNLYHRLGPGSERTLQVHGGAVMHVAIVDGALTGQSYGLLLSLTQP